MKGYVAVHRKLFRTGHWLAPTKKNPQSRQGAWIDLIQLAQYQDYDHGSVDLGRGEFVASLGWLAKRWCWKRAKVQRFLNRAICDTMLDTLTDTPYGRVYRVVKYDSYQDSEKEIRYSQRDTERYKTDTAPIPEQEQTTNKTAVVGVKTKARKTELPPDWHPTDSHQQKASSLHLDLDRETEKFRLHAEATGRKMVRWNAAFSTWLINADDFASPRRNGKPIQPANPQGFATPEELGL